jgi:hypothetical protein
MSYKVWGSHGRRVETKGAPGKFEEGYVYDGTNIVSSRPLGAVVGFRRQGAYGQEFTRGGEPELRRSFHGHREEPGLALTAAGPRHLLLADGRWLQPEPLLYLGIPEELRSDPRALMMYRGTTRRRCTQMTPASSRKWRQAVPS